MRLPGLPNTIGALLRGLFAAMVVLVIAALAFPIVGAWQQYRESGQIAAAARAGRIVFGALQHLRPERGPTVSMLRGINPATPAFIASIRGLRQKSATALDAVIAECAVTDCTGPQKELYDGLASAIGKVAAARAEVDTALPQGLADRSPNVAQDFDRATTEVIDRLEKMSAVLGSRARMADAETAELMEIKQLAWVARDAVGTERRLIADAVVATAMSLEAQTKIVELRANAEAAWSMVRELSARPGVPAELVAAVKTASDEAFGTYEKVRKAALEALAAGRPSPISGDDLVRASNKAVDVLTSVPNMAMELAEAHAEGKRQASQLMLALYLALFAVAVVVAIAGFVIVQRRVTRPIARITSVMTQLADGNMQVAIPGAERADEVGEMARALLTFKNAAVEKVRMEAEMADERERTQVATQRDQVAATAREREFVNREIGGALAELARGHLGFRLTTQMPEAYRQLQDDFNGAMQTLQETMRTIAGATDGIRSGTGEVSQAADDLSKRTEQQAASLEETAAALDQITATVRKTADGADHAREVVTSAKSDAERSGGIVNEAVKAMAQIEGSSKQISQIIGVIDEIAFQTNLLALNAGVEAARAGEAGRGFAVVASEVRALAQRSAEAAKEIKGLIQASSTQVESGVNLVGQAGKALDRIVAQVAEINAIVVEIAASAKEQATGLAEVNTAVNQMDQVTQQNAAMVEESTAASHSLAQEAEELARLVARFDVGAERATVAAMPRARSASAPQRTVTAMKTAGGRGVSVLRKQEPAEEGWEEF